MRPKGQRHCKLRCKAQATRSQPAPVGQGWGPAPANSQRTAHTHPARPAARQPLANLRTSRAPVHPRRPLLPPGPARAVLPLAGPSRLSMHPRCSPNRPMIIVAPRHKSQVVSQVTSTRRQPSIADDKNLASSLDKNKRKRTKKTITR